MYEAYVDWPYRNIEMLITIFVTLNIFLNWLINTTSVSKDNRLTREIQWSVKAFLKDRLLLA